MALEYCIADWLDSVNWIIFPGMMRLLTIFRYWLDSSSRLRHLIDCKAYVEDAGDEKKSKDDLHVGSLSNWGI